MNSLVKFFHEIMHPHCEHCETEKLRLFEAKREEVEQSNRCISCETLQVTNDALMRENKSLVDALIDKNKNIPSEVRQDTAELKPIRTTHIPWNTRRQMLETESRAALRDKMEAAQPNKPRPVTVVINKDEELAEIERELEDVTTGKEKTNQSA